MGCGYRRAEKANASLQWGGYGLSQYHGLIRVTSSDTKVDRLPPMVTLYKIVYRTFKERKANERKEIGVCA